MAFVLAERRVPSPFGEDGERDPRLRRLRRERSARGHGRRWKGTGAHPVLCGRGRNGPAHRRHRCAPARRGARRPSRESRIVADRRPRHAVGMGGDGPAGTARPCRDPPNPVPTAPRGTRGSPSPAPGSARPRWREREGHSSRTQSPGNDSPVGAGFRSWRPYARRSRQGLDRRSEIPPARHAHLGPAPADGPRARCTPPRSVPRDSPPLRRRLRERRNLLQPDRCSIHPCSFRPMNHDLRGAHNHRVMSMGLSKIRCGRLMFGGRMTGHGGRGSAAGAVWSPHVWGADDSRAGRDRPGRVVWSPHVWGADDRCMVTMSPRTSGVVASCLGRMTGPTTATSGAPKVWSSHVWGRMTGRPTIGTSWPEVWSPHVRGRMKGAGCPRSSGGWVRSPHVWGRMKGPCPTSHARQSARSPQAWGRNGVGHRSHGSR